MQRFKDYIVETVGQKGLDYELKVHKAMISANIDGLDSGDKPGAGFSNVGSGDIEATYNKQSFNIEIKSGMKDQMGGGSLRYDRKSKDLIPSPKLAASTEPEDLQILLNATKTKFKEINKYLDFLKTQEPKKLHSSMLILVFLSYAHKKQDQPLLKVDIRKLFRVTSS